MIIMCLQTTAGNQAHMLYGLLRLCLVAHWGRIVALHAGRPARTKAVPFAGCLAELDDCHDGVTASSAPATGQAELVRLHPVTVPYELGRYSRTTVTLHACCTAPALSAGAVLWMPFCTYWPCRQWIRRKAVAGAVGYYAVR